MPIQPKQQPPYYQTGPNIYTLIILATQTSTDPPSLTILTNTYKGKITASRNSAGNYTIDNTENEFIDLKTTLTIAQNTDITNASFTAEISSDHAIDIKSWEPQGDGTYALADGYLNQTTIIIQTYV